MKLMTKAIEKLAQKQYPLGSNLKNQKVVAKFFDPCGPFTWYLMNQDPNDTNYLWGIVNGYGIEMGSFSLNELISVKNKFGLGIERDKYFKPMMAIDVWNTLNSGRHI